MQKCTRRGLQREATVIFLYFVPRGLRLIKSLVWSTAEKSLITVANQADDDNDEAGGEEDTDDNTNSFQTSTTTASTAFEEINKTKQPRRIISYMSPFVGTPYVRKE